MFIKLTEKEVNKPFYANTDKIISFFESSKTNGRYFVDTGRSFIEVIESPDEILAIIEEERKRQSENYAKTIDEVGQESLDARWANIVREAMRTEIGCEGCKHSDKDDDEYPCVACKNAYLNMYELE